MKVAEGNTFFLYYSKAKGIVLEREEVGGGGGFKQVLFI